MSNPVIIILLIVCVILSAIFSGTEMAFAKINKIKLEREVETKKKNKSAKLAKHFIDNYNNTITTITMGNDLVNIASSSLATILFVSLSPEYGELLATVIITVIVLIFGEIIPKCIAASYPYKLSKILAYPMKLYEILLWPFVMLTLGLLGGITKLLSRKKEKVTDEELVEMVDAMEEQGLINEDTQELITNAIDFIDVDAVEIMVHRTDCFAYDIDDDINELINNPELLNYSRIPVYKESIDNIIGILNTKQLIKLHLNGDSFEIEDLLTEPLYVFKSQSISDILKKLRQQHIHMAIVKDEYGGTSGLLTLEDILEELVGEIYDEKDEEEMEEYHKVSKNKFTVDGDMNIYDFFDLIDYDHENYDEIYTTVGGFITGMLEKFPEEDDFFEFEGYKIKVMRATQFTVERASVEKLEIDENIDEEE